MVGQLRASETARGMRGLVVVPCAGPNLIRFKRYDLSSLTVGTRTTDGGELEPMMKHTHTM
eukprot:9492343-Pyramimonas_sp.AAC.1